MPRPREGFGADVAGSLLDLIDCYRLNYPQRNSEPVATAVSALVEYKKFNRVSLADTELGARLETLGPAGSLGGTQLLNREKLLEQWTGSFGELAPNRHSIRQFTGEKVPANLVEEAVCLARWTPSVCNRQAWNIVRIEDKELIAEALSLQTGNRGFGDTFGGLLVVWMSQEGFHGIEERNQAWIDGGMFSMSLLHSLCSKGVGSCPLNWCASQRADRQLRKLLDLPDAAVVVMFIGIGFLPDEIRVAKSHRRSVEEILAQR